MTSRPRIPTLLASLLLTACNGVGLLNGPARTDAALVPTAGNEVSGHVEFHEVDGGVLVDARVSGLAPGGHGFHVHEKGDCSAPDGSRAGGHFNPTHKPHGHPDDPQHHVGDLLMLIANAKGEARLRTIIRGLSRSEERRVGKECRL